MLRFRQRSMLLSTFASGQSCGKAWKSVVQVKHANGSYAIVPSADHVENGCTACVAGDTCPQEINGIPTACKASRCVPCGTGSKQPDCPQITNGGPNHRRTSIDLDKPQDIVVPDTTDLFFNYFPAPPSFNPQNAREY
jgi:hypothetical protein